jgi:hypothetical protein
MIPRETLALDFSQLIALQVSEKPVHAGSRGRKPLLLPANMAYQSSLYVKNRKYNRYDSPDNPAGR